MPVHASPSRSASRGVSRGPVASDAPEGRRARKKREMRERIFQTARTLIIERGFAETRVEDIAARLDISTVTFFNYFGNKDALLVELAQELVDGFTLRLEAAGRALEAGTRSADGASLSVDRPAPSLSEVLGQTHRALRDIPRVDRRLYLELLRVTLPADTGSPLAERIEAALARFVRAGQRQGRIRLDRDPAYLAEMIANTLTGTLNNWLNDPRFSLPERIERAVHFLEEAIEPR